MLSHFLYGTISSKDLEREVLFVPERDEIIYLRFLEEHNEKDLRTLFERYRESLMMFIYGFTGNMDDAEELMMDSFAAVAAGKARYTVMEESTFKTWLFAVGRNQALRLLRRHRFPFLSLEETIPELPDDKDSPAVTVLKEERNRDLYRGMALLKPEYREVLYLLYFEQMSHQEISRVMKKSIKQIYNLADRGRRSLKEKLEEMGFDYAQY